MKDFLRKHNYLMLVVLPLIFIFSVIIIFYFSEKTANPNLHFLEVFERAIITITGEYPDTPLTPLGRLLQLIMLVFGVLLLGTIIGKVSSFFVVNSLKKGNIVKKFKKHIIVCNWNNKSEDVLKQLIEAKKNDKTKIIVLTASKIKKHNLLKSDNLLFVHDDPTQPRTFSDLNVAKAESVILLSDENSDTPDEKNVLIALAIKKIEKSKNIDVTVISELVNPEREKHLLSSGVDEIISETGYSAGIIAQSALFPKMSEVYRRLLTYSDDTNEMYYVKKYSPEFIGKDFFTISKLINEKRLEKQQSPVLLVGIKHEEQIMLNPKKTDFESLVEDDQLIVMSYGKVEDIY